MLMKGALTSGRVGGGVRQSNDNNMGNCRSIAA